VVIVMNVVQVSEGREEDFERAFRERERLLDQAPGFRGFELLRPRPDEALSAHGASHPDDGAPVLAGSYIVVTRWETAEHFHGWVRSDLFRRAHRGRESGVAAANSVHMYEVIETEEPAVA